MKINHTPKNTNNHVHFVYLNIVGNNKSQSITYRGKDCVDKFVTKIEQIGTKIYNNYLKPITPLEMSKSDWIKYNTNQCHICKNNIDYERVCSNGKPTHKSCSQTIDKDISKSKEEWRSYYLTKNCSVCDKPIDNPKVKDHDHVTGEFRGPAHNSCNLNYKVPKHIPIIFHNLEGYDSHLFIKQLGKTDCICIAKNEEKYISFTKIIGTGKDKIQLRFIDSLKFMASSLSNLTKNLSKNKFENMKANYKGEELELLLRKGVYPYDYMDSTDKFNETKLPPINEFYSKLTNSNISDEDYQHAKNVWKKFNLKNMGEYHDLYLKCDTLLLSDVFENFRNVCMENYDLDPAWYYTASELKLVKYVTIFRKNKIVVEISS